MQPRSLPVDIDQHFEDSAGPIWRELRGGLWHSTASHRLPSILKTGALLPTPELAPGEFIWAGAGTTQCRANDSVSLFDFQNADWPWLFEYGKADYWEGFLRSPCGVTPVDQWVSTVWLAFDRTKLPGLAGVEETGADWLANGLSRKWIPRMEVCHRGPLRLAACVKMLVVCAVDHQRFWSVPFQAFKLDEVEKLEAGWKAELAESYRCRALPLQDRLAEFANLQPKL